MTSKRSRKVKKRKKALQRRQKRPTNKPRPLTQIPPEHADQVAMTTTGEIMQPIRLHYEVLDGDQLRVIFATLRCLDYDARQRRWVWLYTYEAKAIAFKDRRAADNTVLGEFVFKGTEEVVLNLRSIQRATQALEFFDKHIPRTVARVTAVTVSNRLLRLADASALTDLDQYFERDDIGVKDPDALMQSLENLATSIPDQRERLSAVMRYIDKKAKQPVPAMERFPFDYADYDEYGLRTVEASLASHTAIAMQHWKGNTDYTRHDLIQNMLRDGLPPIPEPDRPRYKFGMLNICKRFFSILYRKMFGRSPTMPMTKPSVETSLTSKLCSLMRSGDYQDWLQAWELIRDTMPDSITTFDALEALFALDIHDCSVTDLFYELEMELHNAGLEDARLTAKRAELARWVYTHFTKETELTLGNFRSYEAQSLWDIDQRDEAASLFQELIEAFPNFAWGYIWWGDCYWMSDWSYATDPDYDRAEWLYRQALAQPDLDDRSDVEGRLGDLDEEKAHPEKRERIKQSRLQHMQRRKHVD
jgi:hypothetical protein